MKNCPNTLQEAIRYFSNEQVCINAVALLRWPDGKPTCPACGHQEHYYLASQRRWKCKECWKQFSVKVGTIFEDSPLGLDKWLVALWMLVNCKNGVSSYEIHRALGISQKAGWFMLHRLRLVLSGKSGIGAISKMGGPGSEFEADETFVGGRGKNMHKDRKLRLRQIRSEQRGAQIYPGKTAVMGILSRDERKVRTAVIPDLKRKTLQAQILDTVEQGSSVYTDEQVSYGGLADKYVHEFVNHMETYVKGQVHTNGLENFWSLLKRGLNGTYVSVEPYHLFRYLDEQMFRYNNRGGKKREDRITDADRFVLALSQVAGKRLTFAEVTGKAGTTPN